MFDINSLNEKQKNAVSCGFGPVMVIAGAGTGKTRVLTSRIIFLLQNNLVTSDEILSLTFTNKAANEMKKRILDSGFHYLK
jgi:DNA helicase-2/ATP-dependent DNA helicase PcrA